MKEKDITKGSVFGNYTIISDIFKEKGYKVVQCQCNCGTIITSRISGLNRIRQCKLCGHILLRKGKPGDKFHYLTVIEHLPKLLGQRRPLVKVQCDCGNVITMASCMLGKVKTCGCARQWSGIQSNRFCGYENIPSTFFSRIKGNAKVRNLVFDITIEQINSLLVQQNFKCALTGLDIYIGSQKTGSTASLDRIDSSKGYILSNIQWIHKDINQMKMDLSEEKFLYYCGLITKYKNLQIC